MRRRVAEELRRVGREIWIVSFDISMYILIVGGLHMTQVSLKPPLRQMRKTRNRRFDGIVLGCYGSGFDCIKA
jgi:hypothetical protein